MSSSDASTPDPDLAEALAHAKRRRAALERLSVIGMELAEQIGAHASAAMAAINEPKVGDPTRPFATISRAIRLTLALEARVDAQILALRKGRLPAGWAPGSRVAPHDRRVHDEARGGAAGDPLHPARENLVDRETFGGFEFGWLDDEGFANYDADESSLPFMGRVETERSEVRGGEVRFTPETFVSTPTSAPTIQTPPPRSAEFILGLVQGKTGGPSRPSP